MTSDRDELVLVPPSTESRRTDARSPTTGRLWGHHTCRGSGSREHLRRKDKPVKALILHCDHDSSSGAEGPIRDLGRFPVIWRCDDCGKVHQ